MNFERAAELTAVPDDRILEIYNALRPYRSTKEELMAIADDLENRYQAKICAAFVREAATLYVERKNSKATISFLSNSRCIEAAVSDKFVWNEFEQP